MIASVGGHANFGATLPGGGEVDSRGGSLSPPLSGGTRLRLPAPGASFGTGRLTGQP